jgi:hypothetical protein
MDTLVGEHRHASRVADDNKRLVASLLYWLTPMRMIIKRWKYRWNVGFSRSSYRNDLLTGAAAAVGSEQNSGTIFKRFKRIARIEAFGRKAASIAKYEASGISPWVALGKVGLVTDREALALNAMQNDSLRSWALLRMMQRNTDTSRNRTNTAFTVLHPFRDLYLRVIRSGWLLRCL